MLQAASAIVFALIIFSSLGRSVTHASEKPNPPSCPGVIRGVVLSGGGIKGAYQAGAIWYLVNIAGCDFRYFLGTSTGAVTSSLLSQAPFVFGLDREKRAANAAELERYVSILIKNYKETTSVSDIADSRFLGWYRFFLPRWLLGTDGAYSFGPLRKRLQDQIDEKRISNLILMAVSLQSGPIPIVFRPDDHTMRLSQFRPVSVIDFIIGSASIPFAVEPQRMRLWSRGVLEEVNGEHVKVSTAQPPGLADPNCQFQANESLIMPCEQVDSAGYTTIDIEVSGGPEMGFSDIGLQTGAPRPKKVTSWLTTLRLRDVQEQKRRELMDIVAKSKGARESVKVEFTAQHQLVDGGIAQNLPLENALLLTDIAMDGDVDTLFILRAGRDKEDRSDNKIFRNGRDIAKRSFNLLWDVFQHKSFEGEVKGPIYNSWLLEWKEWAYGLRKWRDDIYTHLDREKLTAVAEEAERRFPDEPDAGQFSVTRPPKMFLVDPEVLLFKDALDVKEVAVNKALDHGCALAAALINRPEERFKNIFYAASEPDRASICDELHRIELPRDRAKLDKLKLAEAYFRRGDEYFRMGELDKAIADFTETVRLYERHDFAYTKRGLSYYRKRQFALAAADFEKAVKIHPDNNLAYRARAYLRIQAYDLGGAIVEFKRALEIDALDYYSRYGLASVYYLKDDDSESIAEATRVLQLMDTADAFSLRGRVYLKQNRYDEALADLNEAAARARDDGEVFYLRARAHAGKGEFGKAWEDVEKARVLGYEVHPDFLRQLREAPRGK